MKSALLVPQISLQEDQGGRYLFVVDDDDVVQKHYVQLGETVGDLQVATSGVAARRPRSWSASSGACRRA